MAAWISVTVALFVGILLMLIGREIVCWYWKINEGIAVLRNLDARLANLEQVALSGRQGVASVSRAP